MTERNQIKVKTLIFCYIRFYSYCVDIAMKINYLSLNLKRVIDFLPPAQGGHGAKEENQPNLLCIKADNHTYYF